jgi:hypothetical protein
VRIWEVWSGGQTGADQAGLRAARAVGWATGGWAPRGWRTEAGPAPWLADYGLQEHPRPDYQARTRSVVEAVEAVVLVTTRTSAGSDLTRRLAVRQRVPLLELYPRHPTAADVVAAWLSDLGPCRLAVAGHRESVAPGIGTLTERLLREAFARCAAQP